MLETLLWIIRRDVTIALRRRTDIFTTLIFFVIVVSLFPLGIGPELDTLRLIAPGVVWVGALLASMLALEQLFLADHRDGTLEQMLLAPQPLSLLVIGKVIAHWLITGLPLVIMAPLLGLQYDLSLEALKVMIWSLLLGTPTPEPARRHRRGPDPGPALRRGTGGTAGITPLYTRIDIRCGRGRGDHLRTGWQLTSVHAGRHPAPGAARHPIRHLGPHCACPQNRQIDGTAGFARV